MARKTEVELARERARAIAETRDAHKAIGKAEATALRVARRTLKRRDVSLRDLAIACGMPVTTFHRWIRNGEVKP